MRLKILKPLPTKASSKIFVDENTVLTDMAVHTAQMLGIRITQKPVGPSQTTPSRGHAQTGVKAPPPNAKPKGCQIRPKQTPGPDAGTAARPSPPIVEPTGRCGQAHEQHLIGKSLFSADYEVAYDNRQDSGDGRRLSQTRCARLDQNIVGLPGKRNRGDYWRSFFWPLIWSVRAKVKWSSSAREAAARLATNDQELHPWMPQS